MFIHIVYLLSYGLMMHTPKLISSSVGSLEAENNYNDSLLR